jgi:hypothetical protein
LHFGKLAVGARLARERPIGRKAASYSVSWKDLADSGLGGAAVMLQMRYAIAL